MKKHLLYTGILLATLSLPLSSCNKFLDVKPESKIQDDAIFDNIENLNGYILGLYKDWRDSHKNRIELYAGTDEANMGGIQWRDNNFRKGLETYLDGMNSTNGGILDVWKSRFRIVARASSAIMALSPNESSQDNAFNLRLGEACFLRAVNNFELVQMFGAIPLTGTDMGGKRQSIDLVYKSIESDLQKAIQYLPDPADPNYTDLRRATRAIAQAILGKVYLYAPESSGFRDYTKAAEQFEKVYNNPNPNQFLTSFSDFVSEHKSHPFIYQIIKSGFELFFKTYVLPLQAKYGSYPLSFVGSIAATHEDTLRSVAKDFGCSIDKIIQEPIHNLLLYYINKRT